jgi:hypothetical protein
MELSKDIFVWLNKNKEWFKVSAICKKVGIDKGNFSKYKKSGELPEKFIQPILSLRRLKSQKRKYRHRLPKKNKNNLMFLQQKHPPKKLKD